MNRYSSYKDSGINWIGNIPKEWNVTKASHVFDNFGSGTTPSDNPLYYSYNGEVNWLITGDLNDSHIRTTSKHLNKKAIIDYPTLRIFKPGALVIAMYGATIGKVGILDIPCCTNQACCVIESSSMNMEFYRYYFTGIKENLILMARGGGQPNISQKIIKDFPVIIPSLSEQQAIASYLDSATSKIDAAIAREQKMIDLLNERKQIIINNAVTKGLNPNAKLKDSGVDWIGEIPEDWEVVKLGAIGTAMNGVSHSSSYFGSGFPFVSYSDVYKNIALPKEVKGLAQSSKKEREMYSVERGDVFFTRTSETAEEIGFTSTCLATIPNAVFAGFLIRFRPKTGILYPEFSKYYFRAYIHRSYFVKEMNLVIRASLSQQLLKGLPVLIPTLEEQKRIAYFLDNKISRINMLVEKRQRMITLLQERKQIIINDVVTGKIKVC